MVQQSPWQLLVEADEAYLASRRALFAAGAASQLEQALSTPQGRGPALRVLRDAPVELVMELFEPILPISVATHGPVGLAREVLRRLDPGWLSRALATPIARLLDHHGGADWEVYRRTAEVLDMLDQESLLALVVTHARASSDDLIREVADDFDRTER